MFKTYKNIMSIKYNNGIALFYYSPDEHNAEAHQFSYTKPSNWFIFDDINTLEEQEQAKKWLLKNNRVVA